MDITQTLGSYQLAPDQALEIEENNPLLSDDGSKTLPVNLPGSPHNLKLLGFPERPARREKYQARHRIILTEGVFRKSGTQVVFSASPQGIQSTFYFKEGEFYTQIKDLQLSDLTWPVEDSYSGTPTEKAKEWIKHLNRLLRGGIFSNYFIFPVITKQAEEGKPMESLNAIEEYGSLRASNQGLYAYGITVFLTVSFVLDTLFKHFGYTLKPTLFHTDDDFRRLVLLNTTADTFVTGVLDYRDLLPTMGVDEFLNNICKKFNCAFDLNDETSTAEFYFLDKVLASEASEELGTYVDGDLEITYPNYREVYLSAGTDLDGAAPETANRKSFYKKYGNIPEVTESEWKKITSQDKVYFRKAIGTYCSKKVCISSPYFFLGSDKQSQSYATEDKLVPLYFEKVYLDRWNWDVPHPYVGERRHVQTALSVNGQVEKEDAAEQDLMFCFFNYHIYRYEVPVIRTCYGTPFEYDPEGIPWGKASLSYFGENGLYNRFFKNTDAALRNAFTTITCRLQLPIHKLTALSFYRPYLLYGQPVLLYSLKYSVKNGGVYFDKAEFRTLKLLEPINLMEN